jgi:hypothetical protein
MTRQVFSLIPFYDVNIPDIQIKGHIAREHNRLAVHYSVSGETGQILLPTLSVHPARKDELWKATCFEFFSSPRW